MYNTEYVKHNARYTGVNLKRSTYIFEVNLTFEMLAVRGQQHSFSTHERVFLWKWQSFWNRKCLDLRGTRTINLRIHAECSNLLSCQGQTFAVPWFWTLALADRMYNTEYVKHIAPYTRVKVKRSTDIDAIEIKDTHAVGEHVSIY